MARRYKSYLHLAYDISEKRDSIPPGGTTSVQKGSKGKLATHNAVDKTYPCADIPGMAIFTDNGEQVKTSSPQQKKVDEKFKDKGSTSTNYPWQCTNRKGHDTDRHTTSSCMELWVPGLEDLSVTNSKSTQRPPLGRQILRNPSDRKSPGVSAPNNCVQGADGLLLADWTGDADRKFCYEFPESRPEVLTSEICRSPVKRKPNLTIYFREAVTFTGDRPKLSNNSPNSDDHNITPPPKQDPVVLESNKHCEGKTDQLIFIVPPILDTICMDERRKHRKPGSPMRRSKSHEKLLKQHSNIEIEPPTSNARNDTHVHNIEGISTEEIRDGDQENVKMTLKARNAAKLSKRNIDDRSTQCSISLNSRSHCSTIRRESEGVSKRNDLCIEQSTESSESGLRSESRSTSVSLQVTASIVANQTSRLSSTECSYPIGDSRDTQTGSKALDTVETQSASMKSGGSGRLFRHGDSLYCTDSTSTSSVCKLSCMSSHSKPLSPIHTFRKYKSKSSSRTRKISKSKHSSPGTNSSSLMHPIESVPRIAQSKSNITESQSKESRRPNLRDANDQTSPRHSTPHPTRQSPHQATERSCSSTQLISCMRILTDVRQIKADASTTGTEESSKSLAQQGTLSIFSTAQLSELSHRLDPVESNNYESTVKYKKMKRENLELDKNLGQQADVRTKAREMLFDAHRFDMIIEQIYPSSETSSSSDVFCKEQLTPQQLMKIQNKPPIISYADKQTAIRNTSQLYNKLLDLKSNLSGDITLPVHIPFLSSHQFTYAQNSSGHYVDIGWSGESNVYLGIDHTTDTYVAIKVKKKRIAVNEARMLMLLNDLSNIPIFHGALGMSDTTLLGIVCELVTDGREGRDVRCKDISTFLSLHRNGKVKDLQLTKYQWLDVCIGMCKVIAELHHYNVLSNDITQSNFLLRFEGQGWVPYIADLSQAEREANSTALTSRTKARALRSKYRLWAPEVYAGERRTKATDVFSLAYLIADIYVEARIPGNSTIEGGLSEVPSHRPVARDLMKALIHQRSHFDVDSDDS